MNSIDFPHLQSSLFLPLRDDEVHVRSASLDQEPQSIQALYSLLAPDEIARADRYYFERDRNRFIARRGFLRTILGAYLTIEPAKLQFSYSPYGKPALRAELNGRKLQFNLSHSSDLAVYVVSHDRRVGIDVERVRPMPEVSLIAEQFFSPLERNLIRSLPVEKRLDAFFHIWTCKEAYLKATGDGLTGPLDQIEVSFNQGQEARLARVHGDQSEAGRWRLETIRNVPGYLAVTVGEGLDWQINFWNL